VAPAVAVVGRVAKRRALDRLAAAGALHGRGVDQEIVSRHVNGGEQQVEVGVHRGPLRSAMVASTADLDPAAEKPSKTTAGAVESII
jgi:hypothetical protein